ESQSSALTIGLRPPQWGVRYAVCEGRSSSLRGQHVAAFHLKLPAELFSFRARFSPLSFVSERVSMSRLGTFLGLTSLLLFSSIARAGEADDLQRMVDTARQTAKDLESLD